MKRLFRTASGAWLSGLFVTLCCTGPLLLTSCQPPTVGYQPQSFATLRVMNFSGFCSTPFDIYWDPVGTPTDQLDKQAKVYALGFGGATVYSNGILAAPGGTAFHLVARRTRDTTGAVLKDTVVTLQQGAKYTWILTKTDENAPLLQTFVQDNINVTPADADPTKNAFIRFANEMPGTPKLRLFANDPVTGTVLSDNNGLDFGQIDGQYHSLPAAADVGYAYFVVDQNNSIIGRLVNQTPVAGEYYTLVYSGDLCRTPLENPEDTVTDRQDTLRLRTFDDNFAGNDLTVPVPSSMRFNVINGIINNGFDSTAGVLTYGRNTPDSTTNYDNKLGFVFNTFTLPSKHNFTFDPVLPLHPGGLAVSVDQVNSNDTVYDVTYQNSDLPTQIDIRIFATDGQNDANTYPLYDLLTGVTPAQGVKLVSDHSYSFVFSDTITRPLKKNYPAVRGTIIPIPDVSYKGAVRLVFVPGIIQQPRHDASEFYASFFYTDANGTKQGSTLLNKSGGGQTGIRFDSSIVVDTKGADHLDMTISTIIGNPNTTKGKSIDGPSETFHADAGGIYEVVLLGKKEDPHLVIVRTNPSVQ